jgi:tetratricopeptide (TPR) repeat protein
MPRYPQLLRDAGKTREAFELLDASLAAQPEQPELLYESALLAEKLGRHDVLETNLRKLIRIKPDHAHAYNALGYSFAERNQRLAEAEQLITKALHLSPDDPFIIDSMGWVLYRKGDNAGALTHLQRAFSIRPVPEIAAHLGEVLWVIGRRDEAKKTWQDAAKAHPDNEVLAEVIAFLPMLRTLLAAAFLVLTAGCAVERPRPSARRAGDRGLPRAALPCGVPASFSAGIDWRHDAHSDEIVISGPLGQGLARLTSGGGTALLETADQKRYVAADLDSLSEQVFGTRLPVSGLGRWVLGRSASGGAARLDERGD